MSGPLLETGRNGGKRSTSNRVNKVVRYKVVELSLVTEDEIEQQLNHWTRQGWHFESLHFVVRENSRRPSMAFMFFAREAEDADQPSSD
jgi:hypothetical protein